MPYPQVTACDKPTIDLLMFTQPGAASEHVKLEKGPNIQPLPAFDPIPESIEAPVLLKLGDDVSTDEIMPAGEQVLPYRSNVPEISKFVFAHIDPGFHERALQAGASGCLVVAGANYGQGSSREHAAIAPRYLGVKAVIAKGFARIHEANLVNFGILPLRFDDCADWARIDQGDILALPDIRNAIRQGPQVKLVNTTKHLTCRLRHALTARQVDMILAGSLLNLMRTGREKVEAK
jgi:aconitate hydratase